MQRRTVIKNILYSSGGLLLIPSCMNNSGKSPLPYKKITINGNQEQTLAALADTIIPSNGTPGAKDIGAHLFALKMVDDCFKKADRERFLAGLTAFESNIEQQFNTSFVNCSDAEKKILLTTLETAESGDKDLAYFYTAYKKLVIQAYTTSKYFLTKVQVYELVPSRYHGCVPVKNA